MPNWWNVIKGTGAVIGGTAVIAGGVSILDYMTGDETDPDFQSCAGAKAPGAGSYTEWFRNNCEESGITCTCDDVRDWLCALEKAVHGDGPKEVVRDIRRYTPVTEEGLPVPEVQIVLDTYKARVKAYNDEWGPADTYTCNDTWFLEDNRGRKIINDIHKQLVSQVEFNRQLAEVWEEVSPENAVIPAAVIARGKGRVDRGDDDGPDAGTIGMGLVLGGGLALAMIMMQPKSKKTGL